MTPRQLDPDSVQRKLANLTELLGRLESRSGVTGEDLAADDDMRDSTLWIMLQLVTLAASAANHVVSTTLGRSGTTFRESFELAADAGVLERDLLPSLRGAAAMRNVLAHQYDEVDLERVASAIPMALETFETLVTQLATWLADQDE